MERTPAQAADLINDELSATLWDLKVEVFERLKTLKWFPETAHGPDNEEELRKIMHQLVEQH